MKNRKTLYAILGVLAAALIMFGIWKGFSPKPEEGAKSVTVEVVNDKEEVTAYEAHTDAEYLKGVMDELKADTDFTYEGSTGDYGLYIMSVNGLTADFEKDGAYWAIYVNGEYGSYGADQQPVADGDTYRFAYEKSE